MKKIAILAIAILVILKMSNAQSIAPATSGEFCPNTTVIFSVTVPGHSPHVTPGTNYPEIILNAYDITSSGGYTSFKFQGKFNDLNVAQSYKVRYTNANNLTVNHDFEFQRIKSLAFSRDCAKPGPNIPPIQSPICQINNHSLSFENVKYGLYQGTLCFGVITSYEYMLPTGWSIGSNVSTGANWIAGGNSVTITSDVESGHNGYIRIRPVNTACGSGLKNQQSETFVNIYRPSPVASAAITGPAKICGGSTYSYTLTGVPAGANVSWNSNSYYQIAGSGLTSNVTPYSYASGVTTISANITFPGCSQVFTVSTNVNVGVPYTGFSIDSYPLAEPSCYEIWGIYEFKATLTSGYPTTSYQWGHRILGVPGEVTSIYDSPYYTLIPEQSGTYQIFVRPKDECGVGTSESVKTITVVDYCGTGSPLAVSISPNPAQREIVVTIKKTSKSATAKHEITTLQMELIDFISGTVVKKWVVPNKQPKYSLNISDVRKGIYLLKVIEGSNVSAKQIIVER